MSKEKRIGVKIADYCSIVRKGVYEDTRLGAYEVLGYGVIRSFGPTCWASYASIADRMRCSRRQAIRVVSKLLELGYLTREEKDGCNIFTVYDIPVTTSHQLLPVTEEVTESPSSGDSVTPKADKLNIESKQILESLKERVDRCYKKYPAKRSNGTSTGKSLKHKDKMLKILLRDPSYPMEDAIEYHISSAGGYLWGFDRFLNNLPDPDEFKGGLGPGSVMDTERTCKHELDWDSPKLRKSGESYIGPCIHCGTGIQVKGERP